MIAQLKPFEDSFYQMVFHKLKKIDVLVLCEGKTETELIKALLNKMHKLETLKVIGITDCQGINNIPQLTQALLSLIKLSRKLKTVAILIDAETETPQNRIRMIMDSLKSRGIKISREPEKCCKQTYKTIISVNNKKVILIVSISGIFTTPKERHTIEDHIVKLIGEQKVRENKSRLLEVTLKVLEKADVKKLKQAFPHIYCMFINIFKEYKILQELNNVIDETLEVLEEKLRELSSL